MKTTFNMNPLVRAGMLIVCLFIIIPINTASAADGDEIQVAKIEAWVKGIADPDHNGYQYFILRT